jgi:photosystem II stability/assembly factor-like uncharacterized protein
VRFAKLLNAQQGWVLSDGELYWTEDTGQHWRQLTPVKSGEGLIPNAFFLDPQQAWVLVCEPLPSGDVLRIAHTSDGGTSWDMNEVTTIEALPIAPTAHCPFVHLFFVNAQQGWILVDRTQMHTYVGEMFQTVDGGQTWQHFGTTPSGDFFFVSNTEGWMLANSFGPRPLYRTEDGGRTWQQISVYGSNKYDNFFLPVFFAPQVGMLAVDMVDESGLSDGVTFFKTQDGGTSWEPTGQFSVSPDTSILGTSNVVMWNEQTWVMTQPNSGVYWTLDGGQHWLENTTERSRGIYHLSLGSATSGWGLKCDPDAAPLGSVLRCLHLVATEDTGAHWETIPIMP